MFLAEVEEGKGDKGMAANTKAKDRQSPSISPSPSLGEVDPEGRLDVVCFKGAEFIAKELSNRIGINVWDLVDKHVEELIREYVPADKIEIPIELKKIMGKIAERDINRK